MTHYCDHENIARDYCGRNIWIGLGDGGVKQSVNELDKAS